MIDDSSITLAIKVINIKNKANKPEVLKTLKNEITILKDLDTP